MPFQLSNSKEKKTLCWKKIFHLIKTIQIKEVFNKASKIDVKTIKSYKTLKKLNFIELPKFGFQELKKMIKKIYELKRVYPADRLWIFKIKQSKYFAVSDET